MQKQKNNVRDLLLTVARDEFLKNGVKKTSMQTLAQKSGVAVGNIYNYFKSKDDLLKAILAPMLKAYEEYRCTGRSPFYNTTDVFECEEYFYMMKNLVVSFIVPYRSELKLMIVETAGTSLEHYFDRFIEAQLRDGERYLSTMKGKYPHLQVNLSKHFLPLLCQFWASILKELVVNEKMTSNEQDALLSDYVKFDLGGWKLLMGV